MKSISLSIFVLLFSSLFGFSQTSTVPTDESPEVNAKLQQLYLDRSLLSMDDFKARALEIRNLPDASYQEIKAGVPIKISFNYSDLDRKDITYFRVRMSTSGPAGYYSVKAKLPPDTKSYQFVPTTNLWTFTAAVTEEKIDGKTIVTEFPGTNILQIKIIP